MFRKLVSNLPFSPSLIGQLGLYARRLKKEQIIRRASLIFTVFALIIQSIVMFNPPTSANASLEAVDVNFEITSNVKIEKSAINNTQNNIDATSITANGGDVITYIINITNNDENSNTVNVNINLTDILEYADVLDYGGGFFDKNTRTLNWSNMHLNFGASTVRIFTIIVKNPVPAMAQSRSFPTSFDCVMSSYLGNKIDIQVNCPMQKRIIEQMIVNNLPETSITGNIIFGITIFIIVAFFYARSRQLDKEVRLIRKEFNSGAL